MSDRAPTELELIASGMTDQELAREIRMRLFEAHILAREARKTARCLKVEFSINNFGDPHAKITKTL